MFELSKLDLGGPAFKGHKHLIDAVLIAFNTEFTKHECNAGMLSLVPGDHVIVESERGPFLATVHSQTRRKLINEKLQYRAIRKATDADLEIVKSNEKMEAQAYRFAIERIRIHKLQMKLIRAHSAHDGSKIVFYFSAESRVDFRSIVKDLAQKFRTRIEMFQIGARTGAGMVGGIGSCGRELCCSTFLTSFAPVSIKMAREQGLSLNPEKVSGQCGRLMCCLIYEQQIYRRLRSKLPRRNQLVITEHGKGKVIEVDVIGKRVSVMIEDIRHSFPLDEVIIHDGTDRKVHTQTHQKVESLWEPKKKNTAPKENAPQKKSRRRRKARRVSVEDETKKGIPNTKSTPQPKDGTQSTHAPKKKKSRRRRRKKKPESPNSNSKPTPKE